jgi:hypothetical protein
MMREYQKSNPKRDAMIIKLYKKGSFRQGGFSQQGIANEIGKIFKSKISRERVRQIIDRELEKEKKRNEIK